ncbi:MAG: alanine racemase [Gemmatimonadota bacterium]|nr:alanine racemase [Gemmatimonadota bacterium]
MRELTTLPTPSLLIDGARVERNVTRMATRIAALGARLRPHVKTHKAIEVGRMQVKAGMRGITVSTLAEARAFAAHGFDDITYGVPVEPGKYAAVTAMNAAGTRLAVLTDDGDVPASLAAAARAAGTTVDVYLKVDCGYGRAGVDPEGPALIEVARRIGDQSHLRFAGILTHAGHSYQARGRAAIMAYARAERALMVAAAARLAGAGIPVPTVSIGSTPTASHVDDLTGVHEVRTGNYAFYDLMQVAIGSCTADDVALSVLAAVVHRDPARGTIILDAGSIAMSKDAGIADPDGVTHFGRLMTLEGEDLGLRVTALSQEHGWVTVHDRALLDRLPVGARVRILANHSCLTAAQHAHYEVCDGTRIVDRWVNHRGW